MARALGVLDWFVIALFVIVAALLIYFLSPLVVVIVIIVVAYIIYKWYKGEPVFGGR